MGERESTVARRQRCWPGDALAVSAARAWGMMHVKCIHDLCSLLSHILSYLIVL
jgi:hypothetical protein